MVLNNRSFNVRWEKEKNATKNQLNDVNVLFFEFMEVDFKGWVGDIWQILKGVWSFDNVL